MRAGTTTQLRHPPTSDVVFDTPAAAPPTRPSSVVPLTTENPFPAFREATSVTQQKSLVPRCAPHLCPCTDHAHVAFRIIIAS